jgi:hypothetical protein
MSIEMKEYWKKYVKNLDTAVVCLFALYLVFMKRFKIDKAVKL